MTLRYVVTEGSEARERLVAASARRVAAAHAHDSASTELADATAAASDAIMAAHEAAESVGYAGGASADEILAWVEPEISKCNERRASLVAVGQRQPKGVPERPASAASLRLCDRLGVDDERLACTVATFMGPVGVRGWL